MYWEISKKASERNRHLCYCRHADARVKEKARRIQGIETAPQPGPSAVALSTFKKEASSLEITSTASTRPPAAPEAPANSPKRKRASRTVAGRVESYRDPSEDEGLEGEAPSKPPPKKTKVRVEERESSHSSDSDSDSHKDFNDYFAPSTTSSSRSRSRSTTGTPLSTHHFTSTFSRLTTKASPVHLVTSPAPSSSTSRSQSLPQDREEALLIDRIEYSVSSILRECSLPVDTTQDDESSVQKPKQSKSEDHKPNIPQMLYKLQGALSAIKELAAEGKASADVAKAGSTGLQHLQLRIQELQVVQGIQPNPLKTTTPSDDAMWERLERQVEVDEKMAKRKARAARGYSPSQPYYEDSDDEIQVL